MLGDTEAELQGDIAAVESNSNMEMPVEMAAAETAVAELTLEEPTAPLPSSVWTALSPSSDDSPTARHGHAAALSWSVTRDRTDQDESMDAMEPRERVEKQLVVVFGGDHGGLAKDSFWKLDLATNQWNCSEFSGKPIPLLAGAATCQVGNSLFVYGGIAETKEGRQTVEYLRDKLHHISLPDGQVSTIYPFTTPAPIRGHTIPPALLSASLVHVPSQSDPSDPMKGTLYLFGGLTPQADATDTLWVFDLAGDRKTGWRRMDFGANGKEEFKPGPRSGHSCVVWSEEKFGRDGKRGKTRRLVLYGGNAPGEVPGFRRDDVWVLDIDDFRPSWTRIFEERGTPKLPHRAHHTAHILGDKLIVAFGHTSRGTFEDRYKSADDVWIFDLKSCKWDQVPLEPDTPRPLARNGHASVLDGSTLLVFGGATPSPDASSASSTNDLWTLPLGPPAPMPLPTVTNVTSTSFTVSWTDPCFDQSTSYKVCYRAEEEDNWNELVVDGNGGPRYQVKIDGLKGNQGYEVKVIAVGGKGESSWWGGEEVKDCWTMGVPEQPVIAHIVPQKDHMRINIATPSRQMDSDMSNVRTEIMVRVQSADFDDGSPNMLEPNHGTIAAPAPVKKARKIHYGGISTYDRSSRRETPIEVIPDFRPLVTLHGDVRTAEINFADVARHVNPLSEAFKEAEKRVDAMAQEYAMQVYEAQKLMLTDDLEEPFAPLEKEPGALPGARKTYHRGPRRYVFDSADMQELEEKPPKCFEAKLYVQYEARIVVENEYGRSNVSRAATFQRAVTVSRPIPWLPKPELTDEMREIIRQKEDTKRAEEERIRKEQAEQKRKKEEARKVAREAQAAAKAETMMDTDSDDDDEDGGPVSKKSKKSKSSAANQPEELSESEPDEEWEEVRGSEKKFENELPNEWPYNLGFGQPVTLQWDGYSTPYEARALWYRRAELWRPNGTRDGCEVGWAIYLQCVGYGTSGDGVLFLNDETARRINPSNHTAQRAVVVQESKRTKKPNNNPDRRLAEERRWYRTKRSDILSRIPAAYSITAADLPFIRERKPWRRDNYTGKMPGFVDFSQYGRIMFAGGKSRGAG